MMRRDCYLFSEEHVPEKAAFPVIDAHNHLWAEWDTIDNVVEVMDQVGVACYCDLTANITIAWGGGGYLLGQGEFGTFLANTANHPGRFYGFTTATFASDTDEPLFEDAGEFVQRTVALLREHVERGAHGLKILKELGLHYRDAAGQLVAVDDPRLAPVWEEAAGLGVPVLIHQSDPFGFHQPLTPDNEHQSSLEKYPSWSFVDPRFPCKEELLARRDNLVRQHPGTTFILPHIANFPEDLAAISRLLDQHPNVHIDISARMDELGRQPYTAREFMIRHQDRILFGSDMPASTAMYRCYFRFLETRDEYFIPPDYDGTFERCRWRVHGLGLPSEALAKIYYQNALKIIPGLAEQYAGLHP